MSRLAPLPASAFGVLLAGLLGLIGAIAPAASPASAQTGIELEAPVEIPAFALTDHLGRPFTEASLRDQWTLLMIGYTSCPDVCPFTLANLEHVLAEVSQKVRPDNMPKVVFLALDPERDQAGLGEYMTFFHPDFLGVTGDKGEIDRLVEALDATYRLTEPDATGWYEVQHSSSVAVIDPEGALRAKLQPPFEAFVTADLLARQQIAFRRARAAAENSQ